MLLVCDMTCMLLIKTKLETKDAKLFNILVETNLANLKQSWKSMWKTKKSS